MVSAHNADDILKLFQDKSFHFACDGVSYRIKSTIHEGIKSEEEKREISLLASLYRDNMMIAVVQG